MKYFKLFIVLFLSSFLIINAQNKQGIAKTSASEQSPSSVRDGVLVHISSSADNPQKVLMGLTLALKMADDHDVYIYLDNAAVTLFLNNSKSIEFAKFEASKILFTKLLDKGAKITVCPICLEVSNHNQYELMKGVSLTQKEDFFNFTKGRIISLDY